MPYDYTKNGQCSIHGAFNNHYSRHCPKCQRIATDEAVNDDRAEQIERLAEFDRFEARAINSAECEIKLMTTALKTLKNEIKHLQNANDYCVCEVCTRQELATYFDALNHAVKLIEADKKKG